MVSGLEVTRATLKARFVSLNFFTLCLYKPKLTTIAEWSGGETDYSAGPYTMYLKNLKVTDYSTGDSYSYGDQSGSWESITAENGSVDGNDSSEPKSTVSAPAVTATVDSIPIPWEGTHRQTSSFVTPNVWPWVAKPTASTSETSLPDWAYSGSGSARPPSASAVSEH